MKHILAISIILCMCPGTFAQKGAELLFDSKSQKPILVGETNSKQLQGKDFIEWFQKEYSDYKEDGELLKRIKPFLKGVKTIVVMATWCEDSRREVPRFFKLYDICRVKGRNVIIYCVDRDKNAGELITPDMNIQYVPTFIFYKNGKELGRVVESPVESLEMDILKILSGTKP